MEPFSQNCQLMDRQWKKMTDSKKIKKMAEKPGRSKEFEQWLKQYG